MTSHSIRLQQLVLAAVCLALCLVLPFLTGQIPEIGSMLSPMHIPVLLCGFLCGPAWAVVVGAVAPLLRFALFGMPPLFPTGAAMCFELLTYGVVSGALYRLLPAKKSSGGKRPAKKIPHPKSGKTSPIKSVNSKILATHGINVSTKSSDGEARKKAGIPNTAATASSSV